MQIQRNVVLTATEFNDIFQAISLVIKQLQLNVSEILSLHHRSIFTLLIVTSVALYKPKRLNDSWR